MRIPFEVIQTLAVDQGSCNGATCELCLVLQLRQNIRQLDITLFKNDWCRCYGFIRFNPSTANGKVRLSPLESRLRDGWRVLDCLDAGFQQGIVVELHPVSRLVLNAIPEFLELLAVEYRLSGQYLLSFVGVFYFKLAG